MHSIVRYTLCFCLILLGFPGAAQVQVTPKYSVDDDVTVMELTGDTLILGGKFTSVGVYTGGGMLLPGGSDQPDLGFPKLIGEVYLSTSDGKGGFYVYGRYYREAENNTAASNRIEHILSDNTFEKGFSLEVDALFGLYKILYHNDVLYIGGNRVSKIGGQDAGDLCAVDVRTKLMLPWVPALSGSEGIRSMGIAGNVLYCSGKFTAVAGIPRNSSAAIELNTGIVRPWQPDIDGSFSDVQFYKDKIILGGGFHDGTFNEHACALVDTATGADVQYIFNRSTLYWAAGVMALALTGDTLFAYSGGTYDTRVTAVDLAHSNAILWTKYFDMTGSAKEMLAVPGSLYVAGTFDETFITNKENSPDNFERKITGLVRINTGDGNISNWNADIVGTNGNDAACLSLSGDRLFAGGGFSHANGFLRRNICMIDLKQDTVLPFNIPFDWTEITAIKVADTTLYVGGNIGYIGDTSYSRPVLSFGLRSGQLLPWRPGLSGKANSLAVTADRIIAGGDIKELPGGSDRQNLVAIERATGSLLDWNPNPDRSVDALHFSGGKLYAGGSFFNMAGQPRDHLGAFDSSSLSLTPWNPNVDGPVFAITSSDTTIWIGGQYFNVGGIPSTLFSGIGMQSGLLTDTPTTFTAWSVRSLIARGRYIIAGGGFDLGAGTPCNNIYLYDRLSRKILDPGSFCIRFENGSVYAMTLYADDLYFGGESLKVNGKAGAMNLGMLRFPPGFFDGSARGPVSYYPKSGGNGGDVTINFYGLSISPGMHLKFSKTGAADIVVPDSNMVFPATNEMIAVVDLRGAAIGDYDVTLTDKNGADTVFEKGFRVETYKEPSIIAQIIAPGVIRTGVPTKFIIQLWNTGNVDGYGVPVFVFIIGDDTVKFDGEFYSFGNVRFPELAGTHLIDRSTSAGMKGYLPVIPKIPAYSKENLQFDLSPNDVNGEHIVKAIPNDPIMPSPQLDKDNDGNVDIPKDVSECYSDIYGNYLDFAKSSIPGLGNINDLANCIKKLTVARQTMKDMASPDAWKAFDAAQDFGNMTLDCTGSVLGSLYPPFGMAANAMQFMFNNLADGIKCALDPSKSGSQSSSTSRRAFDPNDKVGTGVNAGHYVTGEMPLSYGIRFENVDTAALPAQVVRIVDTLDKSKFDLATFRLDFFQFGDHMVPVNPAKGMNDNYVDLRPAKNMLVKVATDLDLGTGVFTATFSSLDPLTLLPVSDPLEGFLPPNVRSPEGEGSIYYSVKAKAELPNQAVISNTAHIYFDANEPISTPAWINTLDKAAPVSHMLPLPAQTSDTSFTISWSGSDGESGVGRYDIYYAENGGAYRLYAADVIRDHSMLFRGSINSSYSFYSVATDSVGNKEIKADTAETTIHIVPEDIRVYPNPAHDQVTVTLRQGLQLLDFNLFDARGRKVVVPNTVSGNTIRIQPLSLLLPGVYILNIVTSEKSFNRKVIIN